MTNKSMRSSSDSRMRSALSFSDDDDASSSMPSIDSSFHSFLQQRGAHRRTSFCRYRNQTIEDDFRTFVQPRIPGTMVAVYPVLFLIMVWQEFTLFNTFGEDGYIRYAQTIFFILMGLISITQAIVYCLSRRESIRYMVLMNASDFNMIILTLAVGLIETALVVSFYNKSDCEVLDAIISPSGNRRVYDQSNCHRWIPPFSVTCLVLMVLRRQRYANVVLTSVLNTIHLVIIAIIFDGAGKVQGIRWIALLYTVAMQVFICFTRRELELAERQYFEAHAALQKKLDTLPKLNEEVASYMRNLVPQAIIDRSSSGRVANRIDTSMNAIVLSIGIHNFTKEAEQVLPSQLVTNSEYIFSIAEEAASKLGQIRVRLLHDRIVFCSNLLEVATPRRPALSACLVAIRVILEDQPLRMCAAVHCGPLRGGFIGRSWVRYDVFGNGLTVSTAALLHAKEGEVLLTDEVIDELRDDIVTSEGPELQWKDTVRSLHVLVQVDEGRLLMCEEEGVVERSGESGASNGPSRSNSVSADHPLRGFYEFNEAREAVVTVGDQFRMRKKWWMFLVFEEAETEEEFLFQRMETMTQRATKIFVAYAWLQLILVIVLFLDFFPNVNGFVSLGLFFVSIALSLAIAATPRRLSSTDMRRYHPTWSVTSLIAPLFTMYASAASRPSTLGTDTRSLILIAALVRSPCFFHARHQVIAIPLFLLTSQFQVLLPGGVMYTEFLVGWFIVLYTIVADNENDKIQRNNYITEKRMTDVMAVLDQEREVREGLVRSTLPDAVFHAWRDDQLMRCTVEKFPVPDTMLVLVRWVIPETQQGKVMFAATTQHLVSIERAVEMSNSLSMIKVFGDTAMLVSPVVTSSAKVSVFDSDMTQTISALMFLASLGNHFCIMLDIDTSIHLISTMGLPTYAVMGVGMTRMLAVNAADVLIPGVTVLERSMTSLQESGVMRNLDLVEEKQPPLRIRGVGMLRLVKLLSSGADCEVASKSTGEKS